MKVSNKSDYNNIMRNASKVVKKLIESGAKYSEITRVVNEMASFTSGETIVPEKIRRNVEDVWNGNYKCEGKGENKVYLGCRYDVTHPDWQNLPKGKLNNILKGKFDQFGSVEDILALTYVAALRLCWSECPQDFDGAVANNIMVNVIEKYMELGGDYDEIIDLYNRVGESSVSMDKYGTRAPRKSSDDGSAAPASADDVTPKRKRIKAQELPEEERYFDIDKESERVTYKEIPYIDGFDSLSDIVDVDASADDQRIAREAEERLANGDNDNDVLNDNNEELPPEIAAEIARDEQQNSDLKPGEVVIATTVDEAEPNPNAAEEIKQAEEELEEKNADITSADNDDDEVFKPEDNEPEAEELTSDPEDTSDDNTDDVFNSNDDDDDEVFKPEDDENDFPAYDDVETEPTSHTTTEPDYPAYEDVPTDDDDDVFKPEDDEPFKPEDDDFDADLPKDEPAEENDDVFNSEDNDEYNDEDVFNPDAEYEEDEQPEETPVQQTPQPQQQQTPRRNAIKQGNIMSGNLDEYSNPAMNKFYAENYDDTFFTLNNNGEIGTDFDIVNVDDHEVLDTHTVYRATVDELFKLHTIGNDLDIEYGELNIIIRIKNPILAKNAYNVYSNAQDEVNRKWMNPLMDASIIISKMANTEQIFNDIDEVKTWLDDKGEIQILNDVE